MSTLDLDKGDPMAAEASPAERRRMARERSTGRSGPSSDSGEKKKAPTASATSKIEAELSSRLERVFDRIVKALVMRDDEELAQVVREDSEAMSQGLISLTRSVKFLRSPLLMILNLVEPVLAFGRVGRILIGRWIERRNRKFQEQEEQTVNSNGQPIPVT